MGTSRGCRTIIAGLLTTGFVCVAWAAPIVPERPKRPPDEVISLAHLDRVRVSIQPLPQELSDTAADPRVLLERIKERLGSSGVAVVDEGDVPLMAFRAQVAKNSAVPGAVTLLLFIDVQQQVRVNRLERELLLPTCTFCSVSLIREQALAATLDEKLESLLRAVLVSIRAGTAAP